MENQTKLFQYVIFWKPTKEQEKQGQKAEIIVPLKSILAKDKDTVNIIASRDIPEQYINQLDQIDIAVRPF